jgi:hypothetical protein
MYVYMHVNVFIHIYMYINIIDPLGNHIWPDQQTQIPVGYENMSSASSVITDGSASFAVSRLSAAILHSRFNTNIPQGGVVLSMRNLVLEKDMRGVVASVLQLLGKYMYMYIYIYTYLYIHMNIYTSIYVFLYKCI